MFIVDMVSFISTQRYHNYRSSPYVRLKLEPYENKNVRISAGHGISELQALPSVEPICHFRTDQISIT